MLTFFAPDFSISEAQFSWLSICSHRAENSLFLKPSIANDKLTEITFKVKITPKKAANILTPEFVMLVKIAKKLF